MPLTPKAAHKKDLRRTPSTFTHQHFRTVAAIVRDFAPKMDREGKLMVSAFGLGDVLGEELAEHFADALARTNPKFDRTRFLAAATHTDKE